MASRRKRGAAAFRPHLFTGLAFLVVYYSVFYTPIWEYCISIRISLSLSEQSGMSALGQQPSLHILPLDWQLSGALQPLIQLRNLRIDRQLTAKSRRSPSRLQISRAMIRISLSTRRC